MDIVGIGAPDSHKFFLANWVADLDVEDKLVNADAGRIDIFSVDNWMEHRCGESSVDERIEDGMTEIIRLARGVSKNR